MGNSGSTAGGPFQDQHIKDIYPPKPKKKGNWFSRRIAKQEHSKGSTSAGSPRRHQGPPGGPQGPPRRPEGPPGGPHGPPGGGYWPKRGGYSDPVPLPAGMQRSPVAPYQHYGPPIVPNSGPIFVDPALQQGVAPPWIPQQQSPVFARNGSPHVSSRQMSPPGLRPGTGSATTALGYQRRPTSPGIGRTGTIYDQNSLALVPKAPDEATSNYINRFVSDDMYSSRPERRRRQQRSPQTHVQFQEDFGAPRNQWPGDFQGQGHNNDDRGHQRGRGYDNRHGDERFADEWEPQRPQREVNYGGVPYSQSYRQNDLDRGWQGDGGYGDNGGYGRDGGYGDNGGYGPDNGGYGRDNGGGYGRDNGGGYGRDNWAPARQGGFQGAPDIDHVTERMARENPDAFLV